MAVNIVRKSKNEDEEEKRKQLLAQMQENSQARKNAEIQAVKNSNVKFNNPYVGGGTYLAGKYVSGLGEGTTNIVSAPMQTLALGFQQGSKQASKEQTTWDKIKNIGKNTFKTFAYADPTMITRLMYDTTVGRDEFIQNANEVNTQIQQNASQADSTWKKATAYLGGYGSYIQKQYLNSGLNQLQTGAQSVGQVLGSEKSQQASQALLQADDKLHEPIDKLNEELSKSEGSQNKVIRRLGNASYTIGNMTPSILISALSGGAGASDATREALSLTSMGISAKGGSTREGLKQGLDLSTAERIGVSKGMVEVGTEKMWNGLSFLKSPDSKVGSAIRTWIGKQVEDRIKSQFGKTVLTKWIPDLAGESLEEFVSGIYDNWLDRATVDPNRGNFFKEQSLDTLIDTTLSTLLMNAPSYVLETKAIHDRNKSGNQTNVNTEESKGYKQNLQEMVNNLDIPNEMKAELQQTIDSNETITGEEYNNTKERIKSLVKQNTQQQIDSLSNDLNNQYIDINNRLSELDNIKAENFKDPESRRFYAQQINKEFGDTTLDSILAGYPENRNGNRTVKQYKEIAKEYGKQMAENGLTFDEVRANTIGAWQYYEPNKNITQYDNQQKKNVSFDRLNSQVWSQIVYDSYKDNMRTQLQQQQEALSTQMNDELARLQDEENILIDTIDNLKPKASPEQVARTKKLIEDFAKARGVNLEYNAEVFKNNNEEGFIKDKGNGERTIYINPNADTDTILVKLATHEMFHDTIRTQPHDKLTQLVMDRLKADENYDMYRQSVVDAYLDELNKLENTDKEALTIDELTDKQNALIDEEMTAKYLGEYLGDEQFVQQLVNSTNRSTIQRIVDWIDNRLQQIKNVVTGNKEAEYWRKVRENFEKAYNSKYQGTEGTQYSKDLNISDDGNARFSEDRLNYIIRGSVNDYSDNYARSYITKITPQQFLDLTTTPEGLQRLESESTELNPEQLKGEQQNIFLRVDMETGKVLGHEGRHRMIALRNAGVNNVDIEIIPQQGTYDTENAKDFNYGLYLIGQSMNNGEKGKNVDFTNPITAVTKNNLDKIKQEYLNNNDNANDIRYSKKTSFDEVLQQDNKGRTLTSEQKDYFKDSKVRDRDGNLITLYHGTDSEVTTFDTNKPTYARYGSGAYLTDGIGIASDFADIRAESNNGKARIIEGYANIDKMFDNTTGLTENTPERQKLFELLKERGLSDRQLSNIESAEIDYPFQLMERYLVKDEVTNDPWIKANTVNELLREAGYNGIKGYYGDGSYEYVTFNSNQIKDIENKKPTTNDDIRYSKKTAFDKALKQDNQGRELSENQQEYFKNSKARDENGNLITVYHGSNNAGFTSFSRNHNYYTDSKNVAQSYTQGIEMVDTRKLESIPDAKSWLKGITEEAYIEGTTLYDEYGEPLLTYDNEQDLLRNLKQDIINQLGNPEAGGTYEGYVNIENPIEIDAKNGMWSKIPVDSIKIKGIDNIQELLNKYGSDTWEEDGKIVTSTNDIVDAIEQAVDDGILEADGVIIKNVRDEGGYGKVLNPEESATDYITFNSNQFKAMDNKTPTNDADIRYSKKTKFDEALKENIETTNNGKNLLALHNLTEDKLRGVLELGGFPVPSIAVTNNPMSNANFGEISVVFNKDTINPELDSRNKVYGRDAYTSRIPDIASKINEKGLKEVSKATGIEEWRLRENFKETTLEKAVDELRTSEEILDKYLKEKGLEVKPVYRDFKGLSSLNQDSLQKFINEHPDLLNLNYTDQQTYSTYEKYYNDVHNLFVENLMNDPSGEITRETAENLYKDYPGYNHWNYFIKDLRTVNELNGEQQLDEYATKKAKEEAVDIDSKEYKDFVSNLISPMFEGKYVRNNKEYYTKTGTPRSFEQRYEDYTLENIVKIMNENKGTGQEGSPFGVGIGELAGDASKRFKSIEDIKNNEYLLDTKSKEEYKALLDKYDDEFRDLQSDITKKYGDTDVESIIWRDRGVADAMQNIARKIADGKKISVDSVIKQYNKNNIDVTEKQAQQTIDLLNDISSLPTDYFEAKPQRAVSFDEIDTVVLPSNTSEDIKQALTDRGIKYIEYDRTNENARGDILKALDEYKFNKKAKAFDDYLKANNPNRSGVTIGDLKNLPTKQTQLPTQQSNIANDYIKFRELTEQVKNGDITEAEFDRLSNLDDIQQELKDLGKTDKQVQDIIFELGNLRDNQLNEQDINNLINLMGMNAYDREVARNKIAKGEPILPTTNVQATTESLEIPNEQTSIPLGEQVNPSERKQRKTYKSIIESPVMSEEAKKVARKFIGQDTYTPDSNLKQLERADNIISRLGVEKALNQLESNAMEGRTIKAEDIATGDRLIEYYSKIGDGENLQRAIRATAMAGTQAGRSVQAFALLKHQTPQGMAVWIQNSVDKLNSQTKNGQFDFTTEMQEKILNSTEDNLQENVDEVMKELGQQVPQSLLGKLDTWRYFSMLANPKTHIRNIVGNFAMGLTQQVKSKVAGTIEQVTGQDRTHTSLFEKRSRANIDFAKNDLKNVSAQLGIGESKYSNPKNQIQQNQRVFKSDALEKSLGRMFKLNDNLLEAEDNFGLKNAYVRNLSDYMTANKLNPKTITNEQLQQARKVAVEEALRATFHQESSLASMLNQIENKNLASRILMGGLVPFKKTPINVAKSGFEYSPAGLAKAIVYDSVQLRKGNINVNEYIDNISKGLTGTGIALVGYALAEAGILKAGGDDDKDEKYKQAMGEQPYSIMINGKSYSLDWLAPTGIPLFVGAELNKLMHDKTEKDGETQNEVLKAMGRIADASSSLLNPMSEMSMISGLTSTLQSYSQDPGQALMNLPINMLKSYTNQFVPTAVGQVARTMDKYERDTSSTETGLLPKAIDQTKNQIMNKIPGLRQMLPTKKDVWGEEVETQDYFHNAVLPYTEKEIKTNAVDKELNDLFERTGESIYPNTSLSKTVTYEGSKTRLTNQDYNDFKTNYGKTSYKLLEDLTKSQEYKGMTDAQKVQAIKDVYTYANNLNKTEYAEKKGIEFKTPTDVQQVRAVKAYGGKESDYFKYKGITDGLSKDSEKLTALKDSNLSAKSKRAVYSATLGKDDTLFQSTNIDVNEYLGYKTANIQGTKDSSGKTISGTKKTAQLDYINNNISGYENRLLLMGKDYKLSRSQQQDLAQYIYTLDNAEDLFEIYSKNFTIKNGNVYYK